MRRETSFFCVGLFSGLLLATGAFAWMQAAQRHSGDGSSPRQVLKLAHSLDQNHPVHRALLFMQQRVDELSEGSVELQIFPNGQLGSETECLEQVQRGALAITKVSTAPLEGFVPAMAVFSVPYVFRDDAHFWKVLEGPIGDELLASGEGIGLVGLCFYDAGSRSFYTIDQPILVPEDLHGLKIRVQASSTSMNMVEALGGAPTPVSFGELYTALQQRMVDGAENNPPSFFTSRHFEVCKHLTLDEHTRVPDIIVMHAATFDRLSPLVQQWVRQAAAESAVYQRQIWAEDEAFALAEVEKAGVTIQRPNQQLFAERVAPMHASYQGTAVGDLLERIADE